jgi:hypothetical protein
VPIIVVLAGAGQLASFAAAYRRFSVGIGRPYSDVLTADAWQAPGGLGTVVALFGVGAVGLVVLTCAVDHASRTTVRPEAGALAR